MATYLGSLVQLCCGEGGTLQTNISGLCGECSQCMDHTAFAPAYSVSRVLPELTLLSLQGALQGYCPKQALHFVNVPGLSYLGSWVLHKGTDLVGEHFVPFPGLSSSSEEVLGKHTVPGGLCILITSLVLAAQFAGSPP